MIAIIQTATNAARTTNETQVQKVPNGRPQGAYGGLTDLFAKLDNAASMPGLCSGNGKKVLRAFPNTRICNS